jgi:hypothetical protein
MIGRAASCDFSLEKLGGIGAGFIRRGRGPTHPPPVTFNFLPPDFNHSPIARQRSVCGVSPYGQSILHCYVKRFDIMLIPGAITLAGFTMLRQEKTLTGCRARTATQPSCHEEVVHVPAACSNAR